MKTINIKGTDLAVSAISYGCMEIHKSPATAMDAVQKALDCGINHFDHADLYGRGKSEEVFSKLWDKRSSVREKIVVQSKCGIRERNHPKPGSPARADLSGKHIIATVEASIKRLKTDFLDILLLHRPDGLFEPDEIATTFDQLQNRGLVCHFGVSNFCASQIELLKKSVQQPLLVNQIRLSLMHHYLLTDTMRFNENAQTATVPDTVDYCRQHDMLIQAWGPLDRGKLFQGRHRNTQLNKLVVQMAKEKSISTEAIQLAWLQRHGADIQPIIGSTQPQRIQACCDANNIILEREEWYRLNHAAQARPPFSAKYLAVDIVRKIVSLFR